MKGSYRIRVEGGGLKYNLILRRNITIIRGNSATGKSSLVDLVISSSNRKTPVKVECRVPVIGFDRYDSLWRERISQLHNSILFFDEGCSYTRSRKFSEVIKSSDCYFVFVTRNNLCNLPYSVSEIYELVSSGRFVYGEVENKVESFYKSGEIDLSPDIVIVEDTNSGYEFFKNCFDRSEVVSANGNSNIKYLLEGVLERDKRVLVIVDGAAYGAYISSLLDIANSKKKNQNLEVDVLAKESFEYLLLMSKVLYPKYKKSIDGYEDNIESFLFFSWERYFTWLIETLTKNEVYEYSKRKLNPFYLSDKVKNAILEVIKE